MFYCAHSSAPTIDGRALFIWQKEKWKSLFIDLSSVLYTSSTIGRERYECEPNEPMLSPGLPVTGCSKPVFCPLRDCYVCLPLVGREYMIIYKVSYNWFFYQTAPGRQYRETGLNCRANGKYLSSFISRCFMSTILSRMHVYRHDATQPNSTRHVLA